MVDLTAAQAAKDKLDKDFAALVASQSTTVTQGQVDTITAEITTLDTDVVAASGSSTPALDFSKFDASLAKLNTDAAAFKADSKVAQAGVDSLQTQIDMLDAAVVAGTV